MQARVHSPKRTSSYVSWYTSALPWDPMQTSTPYTDRPAMLNTASDGALCIDLHGFRAFVCNSCRAMRSIYRGALETPNHLRRQAFVVSCDNACIPVYRTNAVHQLTRYRFHIPKTRCWYLLRSSSMCTLPMNSLDGTLPHVTGHATQVITNLSERMVAFGQEPDGKQRSRHIFACVCRWCLMCIDSAGETTCCQYSLNDARYERIAVQAFQFRWHADETSEQHRIVHNNILVLLVFHSLQRVSKLAEKEAPYCRGGEAQRTKKVDFPSGEFFSKPHQFQYSSTDLLAKVQQSLL